MTRINLSNLFTTPLSNAAQNASVNFKGSELQAFQNSTSGFIQDNFTSNPMNSAFKSKAEIERLAKSNPRIMALLNEYNLPLKVNMDVLEEMR